MQKPHVLQWLALGGRHMLHVEQYLRHSHSLVSSELSSTLLSRVFVHAATAAELDGSLRLLQLPSRLPPYIYITAGTNAEHKAAKALTARFSQKPSGVRRIHCPVHMIKP